MSAYIQTLLTCLFSLLMDQFSSNYENYMQSVVQRDGNQ